MRNQPSQSTELTESVRSPNSPAATLAGTRVPSLKLAFMVLSFVALPLPGLAPRSEQDVEFNDPLVLRHVNQNRAAVVLEPILLLHGLGSNGSTWTDLVGSLPAGYSFGGFPEYDETLGAIVNASAGNVFAANFSDWDANPFPSQNLSLHRQGQEVALLVRKVLELNPEASTVRIAAHSMGGLAARAYLQGLAPGLAYNNDVSALVTVGTPHHGAFLANLCRWFSPVCLLMKLDASSPAVTLLAPGSTELLELNDLFENRLPTAIEYTAIAGVGWSTIGDETAAEGGPFEPGDGVVPLDSQDPGFFVNPWEVLLFPVGECGSLQLHTCETRDFQIRSALRQRLVREIACEDFAENPCDTSGVAPLVTTLAATSVSSQSAMLTGHADPNGPSGQVWFSYSGSSGPGVTTSVGTIYNAGIFTKRIDGLSCGTTYSFRAHAANAVDSSSGSVRQLQTDDCPSGGIPPAEDFGLIENGGFEEGTAHWAGQGDFHIDTLSCPRSGDAYAFLAYQDGTPGDGLGGSLRQEFDIPEAADQATLEFWVSVSTQAVNQQARDGLSVLIEDSAGNDIEQVALFTDLDANGCHYEQVSRDLSAYSGQRIAVNFVGLTQSEPNTATVFRIDDVRVDVAASNSGPGPAVRTLGVSQITQDSARLAAEVDPNGRFTDFWFDFEANDETPNDDTEHVSVGSANGWQTVNIDVVGLECGVTYYYEANAENSDGSDRGLVRSFETLACSSGNEAEPPVARTDGADQIERYSVRLRGRIHPGNLPTTGWYSYGIDRDDLAYSTSPRSLSASDDWRTFNEPLDGLDCDRRYFVKLHSQNSAGYDDGVLREFYTGRCNDPTPTTELLLTRGQRQGCLGSEPALTLSWLPVEGANDEYVVRRLDGGYTAAVEGTTHVVGEGLEPHTKYQFVVEATRNSEVLVSNAVDALIESEVCGTFPIGNDDAPPPPVLWADAPYCEDGQAKLPLFWNAPRGSDRSRLHRQSGVAGWAYVYDGNATSFVDTLPLGSDYSYSLRAYNGDFRNSSGSSVFGTIATDLCGAEPGQLGPFEMSVSAPACDRAGSPGPVAEARYDVTWTESSGATDYFIVRQEGSEMIMWINENDLEDDVGVDLGNPSRLRVLAKHDADPDDQVPAVYRYAENDFRAVTPLDGCPPEWEPRVGWFSARWITSTGALFYSGGVRPNGTPTFVSFRYGIGSDLSQITPEFPIGNSYSRVEVDTWVDGLQCDTEYSMKVLARNDFGNADYQDHEITTFRTEPCVDPPVVAVESYDLVEDSTLTVDLADSVLDNDFDPEGHPLTATLVRDVAHGALSLSPSGTFTYQPDADFSGQDSFEYAAESATGVSSIPATVLLNISEVNDLPIVQLIEPSGGDDETDLEFEISWVAYDPDHEASVSLAWSRSSDCSQSTAITSGIPEAPQIDRFLWNTAGVPNGHVWIRAEATDPHAASADCEGPLAVRSSVSSVIFSDGFESGSIARWQ